MPTYKAELPGMPVRVIEAPNPAQARQHVAADIAISKIETREAFELSAKGAKLEVAREDTDPDVRWSTPSKLEGVRPGDLDPEQPELEEKDEVKRSAPLKPKRDTPRRNTGRVAHKRTKPRSGSLSADQASYHRWVRQRGRCEACGACTALVVHHLMARAPGKSRRRDEWYIVLLCARCHNMGADSVHLLGSEAKFLDVRGVDLVAISCRRLEQWKGIT